jgi:hypothetical protein
VRFFGGAGRGPREPDHVNQIRPWLFVGGLRDARDRALLDAHGVGAVLQVADPVEHDGLPCRYVPLEDGEPIPDRQLRSAVDFARAEADAGRVVLVACALGISRSVSVAVALLHEREGIPLTDAFRAVREAHPEARPHPVLWRSLCDHYGQPASYPLFRRSVLDAVQ